jgi:pimeloyl-ACP methyl ester carboxylesterase
MLTSFTIPSSEGLPIRGDIDMPGKPRALVAVIHGFKGFKDWGFFPWLAERLCDAGYAVVRFNMSRSGIGENPETFEQLDLFAGDTYSQQLSDLQAVLGHVQKEIDLPLFLLGHSRGGGIALLGAGAAQRLRGVVTWSAISHVDRWDRATIEQWRREGYLEALNTRTRQMMRMSTRMLDDIEANPSRLDIRAAAAALAVPALVVHGAKDESVPVEEASEIAGRVPDAAKLIIGNASHTYNAIHPLVNVPFELSLAAEVTVHFLAAHV